MAFANASNDTIKSAAAEIAFAAVPSIPGSRPRGRASGGSSLGNARLTSCGATNPPQQKATAPRRSSRPAHATVRQSRLSSMALETPWRISACDAGWSHQDPRSLHEGLRHVPGGWVHSSSFRSEKSRHQARRGHGDSGGLAKRARLQRRWSLRKTCGRAPSVSRVYRGG